MNLLGIDYGKKRLGLAWVQAGLDVVLPFGVVEQKNAVTEIVELVRKENIDTVVCGLPLSLDGEGNENTKKVKDFVAELKAKVDCPIELIDERFTSAQADRTDGDATRDEKAAMLILQAYLDTQKK